WIFMMVMSLLIPLSMIGFGTYLRSKAPKKINYLYGYRTSMSMKNKDTWDFAHNYFGSLWYKTGWIVLFITVIAMLMLLGKDTQTIGILGAIIVVLQCIPMLGVIIPTEKALKKNFDEDGNRR
ncbi:MAG: SdpI family protein, partial [Tissierellia bacterium]|nr:SdpI family protein [Tissierellia bacterium]